MNLDKSHIEVLKDFKKSQDRMLSESTTREPRAPLSFGVQYLDDCLKGISKNDLVVVVAKSGLGKTQLASIIAMQNARASRVHFFALEAYENEIEHRILYQHLSRAVFGSNLYKNELDGKRFNYMDWVLGEYQHWITPLENQIKRSVEEELKGLSTYYQSSSRLTEENIEKTISSLKDQSDLIIIDHLHYFSFVNENETSAMKNLMKTLKLLSESYHIPIVLLAHFRKTDKKHKTTIPDIEDIHGSSDIFKIATKVVVIAKAKYDKTPEFIYPTYLMAGKNRYDMSRTHSVAICGFDVRENRYEKNYIIGEMDFDGVEFKHTEKIPYWAEHAIITSPAQVQPPQKLGPNPRPSAPVQRSWLREND